MGKLVNVVLNDGRVVSVPEDVAEASKTGQTSHLETSGEAAARETNQLNTERTSTLTQGVGAGVEGLLDTTTFGGYGAAITNLPGDEDLGAAQNYQLRAANRPGARFLGEAVGMAALPGLGSGASLAARAGEGALYGIGGAVTHSNVSGDPLTIEGVVADAGIGAIIGVGLGKISDTLISKGKAAKVAAELEAQEAIKAEKAASIFESNPESYNELLATHKAEIDAIKDSQKEYDRIANQYFKDTGELVNNPSDIRNIIEKTDVLERRALSQMRSGSKASDTLVTRTMSEVKAKNFKPELTTDEFENLVKFRETISKARKKATKLYENRNYSGALDEITKGIDEAKTILPEVEYPNVPRLNIGERPNLPPVELPPTLKAFAKLQPETVAKFANSIENTSATAAALAKFTDDVGLQIGATAGETVAGVHATLNSFSKAAVKDAADKPGKSFLGMLRSAGKNSVKYGASRIADRELGGGFVGATGKSLVASAVGFSLGGIEGAILGASLVNSKAIVTNKINTLFAKYGERSGNILGALPNVTAYLSTRILDGSKDDSSDHRTQALNRVSELQQLGKVVNDASFTAVQPLTAEPNDIAFKLHQQIVNSIAVLNQQAPKDPGLATNMFNSFWKPTQQQAIKLAYQIEATLFPMRAIDRLIAGGSTMEAANTLWNTWPAHMQIAANAMANNAAFLSSLTREQSSSLSTLFRVPLNGFRNPVVMASVQKLFLPPQSGSSTSSGAPSPKPRMATGRPAAVNNLPNPNLSLVQQLQR